MARPAKGFSRSPTHARVKRFFPTVGLAAGRRINFKTIARKKMINVKLNGLTRLERFLKSEQKEEKKALSTAIKVEGFRLIKLLRAQIRQGAPGGKRFVPLSFIARYESPRRRNRPLASLARMVRSYVPRTQDPEFHFGWTGPRVSRSWKRIAEKQQEGFTARITDEQWAWLRRKSISKRVPKRYQIYFRIPIKRKTFTTPARPILDPFWEMSRETAWRNIKNNYIRKRRGERI